MAAFTTKWRGFLATGLIACTALGLAACGSSGSTDAASTSTAPSREAGGDSPLKTVATAAFGVYGKVNACLENRKIGRPCTSGDGGNIRETLKQVKELRATVDANHAQALAEFDRIAALVIGNQKNAIEGQLRPVSTNSELAMRAYQALMECAVSTESTCRPFIGGKSLGPAEPTKTAIEETEAYLQRKLAELPNVPVTAAWFTGDKPGGYNNGLASAIWKFNKQEYEQQSGVTKTATKNAATVPIVTRALATAQNQDVAYWNNLFNEFGFLSVVKAGTKPGATADARQREAKSVQAEVDSWITGKDRSDVYGSAEYYSLPALPRGAVAVYDQGKAWVLAPSAATGGRPAVADDIRDMATTANAFSSVEKLATGMPPDRWYNVQQPIIRRQYTEFGDSCSNKQGGKCPEFVKLRDLNVAELAGAGAAESCTAKMRPMNAQPEFPQFSASTAYVNPGKQAIYPYNDVWKKLGQGPVDWQWDIHPYPSNTKFSAGWGAWVICSNAQPSARIDLVKTPAVMGPAA